MIDTRLFKDDPEKLKNTCRLKRVNIDIDRAVELDGQRRELIVELENLQAERNRVSKEIGTRKAAGEDASAEMEAMKEVGAKVKELDARRIELEEEVNAIALAIPNHPAADVPEGDGENENVEIATWGEKPKFDFAPKAHWELCEALDIIDFQRGVKLSGSGFILYKGLGARLERALYNFFLDLHTTEHGYTEWFPPVLVNRASMIGTGQLPKMEEDMYCTDKGDDLFLIPTAEVPITNIHRDEILNESDLPLYYTAYSPCFRREAGAAGKDTRGLLRVHEFNKVEMVKFCAPETSYDELEKLRANVAKVFETLGLHYRILKLCTGDISFAAAKCYDFECWAPGVEKFLECSSCSNFEDFQARRAKIRYKSADKKTNFVHTLNASGVALPRTMVALLETYQQADGSILIPEVIRPYMGGLEKIEKK
ncbi:MAG: serine--tRNA ligase [Planctomycetes bacterium]|nr:serine--tRNA ligase [Planctomycetota bacterium]